MAFDSHKVRTYGRHKQRTITSWISPDADPKSKHIFSSPEIDNLTATSNSNSKDTDDADGEWFPRMRREPQKKQPLQDKNKSQQPERKANRKGSTVRQQVHGKENLTQKPTLGVTELPPAGNGKKLTKLNKKYSHKQLQRTAVAQSETQRPKNVLARFELFHSPITRTLSSSSKRGRMDSCDAMFDTSCDLFGYMADVSETGSSALDQISTAEPLQSEPSKDDHVFDLMETSALNDFRKCEDKTASQRTYSSTLDVAMRRVTRSNFRRICTSTPEADSKTKIPAFISNGDVQDTSYSSPHQANCGCKSCTSRHCGTPNLFDLTKEISRLSLNNTNNYRPSVDKLVSPCSVVVTPLSFHALSIHSTSSRSSTSQEMPETHNSEPEAKPQLSESRNPKSCDCSTELRLQNSCCQSFKEALTPVKSKATGQFMTPRQKVLQQCNQTGPIPFAQRVPPEMMKRCVKIGEGVYGEVFQTVNATGQMVALKMIPIEGDVEVNGEPQKSFEEILPEIVISRELSALREGEANVTGGFIMVNDLSCCQGSYPSELLNQWDEYDARRGSENDRPDFFLEDQLFIVFEFADGGVDLEAKTLSSMYQAVSILQQVAISLAVAEQRLEFEHRDLHWGNILVLPSSKRTIQMWLDGQEMSVATHGVLVGIIDFTLSRLKKDGCTVFCDLSNDETLFTGQGDLQFDVYRKMKDENDNVWEAWNPHTNVLWLHYLLNKLLNSKTYPSNKLDSIQSSLRRKLRNFGRHLLDYASALSVVRESNVLDF